MKLSEETSTTGDDFEIRGEICAAEVRHEQQPNKLLTDSLFWYTGEIQIQNFNCRFGFYGY